MQAIRSTILLRRAALGALLATAVLLGACHRGPGGSCTKPGLYVQAESVPPLRIPSGLEAPDTRGALRVPDLNEPEVPRAAGSPCLDQPPRYSNSARLEPPPKEKGDKKRGKAVPPPAAAPAAPVAAPAPATTP